jgi:hypothetical protein
LLVLSVLIVEDVLLEFSLFIHHKLLLFKFTFFVLLLLV